MLNILAHKLAIGGFRAGDGVEDAREQADKQLVVVVNFVEQENGLNFGKRD